MRRQQVRNMYISQVHICMLLTCRQNLLQAIIIVVPLNIHINYIDNSSQALKRYVSGPFIC